MPSRRPARLTLLLLLAAAAPAAPDWRTVLRPDPRAILPQAERDRAARAAERAAAEARARAAAADAQRLATARQEAATRLRSTEQATAAAAARLTAATAERQAAETRLAALQAALQPLLPLMQRLSLYPAETLLAAPLTPDQAVTGLLIVKGLTERLHAQAEALRTARSAADAARLSAQQAAAALTHAETAQSGETASLDRALLAARAGQAAADQNALAAARAASEAAARTDSLKSAIATADATARRAELRPRQPPAHGPPPPLAPLAAGPLTPPVAGTLVHTFGQPTEAGPATGISYQTAGGARVVSPCHGRLVFGAPFRSFGLLAIFDCGGGWHVVLSGLARLDQQPGTILAGGQPIGLMPPGDPHLYVELRRNGQPVDPTMRLIR